MVLVPFALFFAFFAGLWLVLDHLAPPMWRAARKLDQRFIGAVLRSRPLRLLVESTRTRLQPYAAYSPAILAVVVGAVFTLWAGDTFADLAELLHSQSPTLRRVDRTVYDWATDYRNESVTPFFLTFAAIGTPLGLGIIAGMAAVVLAIKRRYRWAIYLLTTSVIGGFLNLLLKSLFARSRPELSEALRSAHGYSFPSGHAMGSTIVFCALGYVMTRALMSWRSKSAALAFATSAILAICLSRIYLGVHWISDIGAGISAGIVWVTFTTMAYETTRRVRAIRKRQQSNGDTAR